MFHDERVQEMKEQLGPSYNSLSLQSDSLCLLISLGLSNFLHSIYKSNFTYLKVVDETNNITYDNVFIIVLPLFSCHLCFDIPLLPFIQ